jgi:hypothetical protein
MVKKNLDLLRNLITGRLPEDEEVYSPFTTPRCEPMVASETLFFLKKEKQKKRRKRYLCKSLASHRIT